MPAIPPRVAACLFSLISGHIVTSVGQSLPSPWRTGIATNYGGAQDGMNPYNPSFGTTTGTCGYGLLDKTKFPYWSVAALSTQNIYYLAGPQTGCGECFEIQCVQNGSQFPGRCNSDPNARSVTVMVTDACPECEPDHIDIQALTFNKMAPMQNGRIDMQYRRVNCVPPSGLTISVDINNGAGGWLRLTVQKVAGVASISLIQIRGQASAWQSMNNLWGATWEITTSPSPPLDLRIVLSDGSEVTAFGFIDQNGMKGMLPVGVNFATNMNNGITAITTFPGLVATDLSSAISSSTASSNVSVQVSAFEGPGSSSSSGPRSGPSPSPSQSQSSPSPQSQVPPSSQVSPTPSTQSQQLVPAPNMGNGPSCSDTIPPGNSYSCLQQKQWGACSSSFMTPTSTSLPWGFCAHTCGRC